MKILLVNKFLHPNGGSETYIFGLGEQLRKMGHDVFHDSRTDHKPDDLPQKRSLGSYLHSPAHPLKSFLERSPETPVRFF